ncbi:nuclear transport factor 2 family protein [Undibacterium sp. TS12]|uniref:nuclear transport factor 2 family protein n=1 Tax=Undibacterium sp. TS12 TaxID=2908202 RepID=UPI001F4D234B|nr:nuclear transport factor 2 family protein [Undibacterium sp. TS12]MCH8617935.1 nuclear transport factor 2 family protein [Undibacterium sp. TS12]
MRHTDLHAIQNLLARFANSFDLKDWDALRDCLTVSVYTDYSELRGTPPEQISNQQYADLRRIALQDLLTHHVSGNTEIDLDDDTGDTGKARVSSVIYRKNSQGETLHTHCLYQFGLQKQDGQWLINAIIQKVFWSDGQAGIHRGIVK